MTPQLVDLNADGYQDILAATFEGTAFLAEGSKKGWKEPQHIKDENDTNVRISFYWDLDKSEYQSVDRSTDEYETVEDHHMTSIAAVDWDDDGDLDLILGAYEGGLYRCMNIGTKSEPKFEATNHQIKIGDEPFKLSSLSNPRVVDWNQDGLWDLLVGTSQGEVHVLTNKGEKGKPEFTSPEKLIDIRASKFEPIKIGNMSITEIKRNAHMEACDYDGDGDLDLLVGAQTGGEVEKPDLSDEEQNELEELEGESSALSDKMSKFYEGIETAEEAKKLRENEEFKKVSDEFVKIRQRINKLNPQVRPPHLIWLYRNKAKSHVGPGKEPSAKATTLNGSSGKVKTAG
jgi:hypothetical protein